jgi:2,3-bisphosphoglycerate-independent phosphoglycerate mutase
MKYALIIPDGAADTPIPELAGNPPLQAARKPHMDSVASNGQCGVWRNLTMKTDRIMV